MRVLSSVTDPRLGGPQRRSLAVAEQLLDREIETVFLIPDGADDFVEEATDRGFDTHRVSMPRIRAPKHVLDNLQFLGRFPGATREIRSLITDVDVDVIHANMAVNFQTALAAAQSNASLVWHFNDVQVPTPVRQIASRLGRSWADELVVAAEAVHEFYFPPATQTRTIFAPVDVETFDPVTVSANEAVLREDLGIPKDRPVIGTIGNLNPIKGHKHLLRAVDQLSMEGRTLAVPVIGKHLDSQKQYRQQLYSLRSSLGLTDTIKFVGFRSDVPELLSLFDVFVLLSIAEACPMVVLEAMAMECLIVATGVGGVPQRLPSEEYGWTVPPADSKAMADAIGDALDSQEEQKNVVGRHEN
jgi:glycosyltransferase involved in cell wall biosynthesis